MAFTGRVAVFAVDQDSGAETFDGEAWLDDLFEPDDAEKREVEAHLRATGRAYIGGGAAQMFLLFNRDKPQ